MMNCKKCHSQCKAICCGVIPMSEKLFEENKDKIVTHPEHIERFEGPDMTLSFGGDLFKEASSSPPIKMVLPQTKSLKCCFLNEDLSCNIYETRPAICRKY